jgi:hypothetical protein
MVAISHSGHLKIRGSTKEVLSMVVVAVCAPLPVPPASVGRADRGEKQQRGDSGGIALIQNEVQCNMYSLRQQPCFKPKYNRLAPEFVLFS